MATRLEFVVALRDSASPGLRSLVRNAEGMAKAFENAGASGGTAGNTIASALRNAAQRLGEMGENIEDLVSLRLATAALSGTFQILTSAISLSLGTLSTMAALVGTSTGIIGLASGGLGTFGSVGKKAFQGIAAATKSWQGILIGAALALGLATGAFYLFKNEAESTTDLVSSAFEKLGESTADLALFAIPLLVKGAGRSLAGFTRETAKDLDIKLKPAVGGVVAQMKALEATGLPVSSVLAVVANRGSLLSRTLEDGKNIASALLERFRALAEKYGPAAIDAFYSLSSSITTTIQALNSLEGFKIDSVFGQLRLAPGLMLALLQKTAEAAGQGVELTRQEIVEKAAGLQTTLANSLLSLFNELPTGIQGYVGRLVNDLAAAGHRAQLQEAFNSLLSVLKDPGAIEALETGQLTEQQREAVEQFRKTHALLLAERKKFQEALGLLGLKGNKISAAQQEQAALSQAQTFLQTSSFLLREKKKESIALAFLGAGVGIVEAIKHSAGYGPAYLAFYVGSVIATLAAQISSIKSGTAPPGISAAGGGASPAAAPVSQAPQAAPQISLSIRGRHFSQRDVTGLVEELNRSLSPNGQLGI